MATMTATELRTHTHERARRLLQSYLDKGYTKMQVADFAVTAGGAFCEVGDYDNMLLMLALIDEVWS